MFYTTEQINSIAAAKVSINTAGVNLSRGLVFGLRSFVAVEHLARGVEKPWQSTIYRDNDRVKTIEFREATNEIASLEYFGLSKVTTMPPNQHYVGSIGNSGNTLTLGRLFLRSGFDELTQFTSLNAVGIRPIKTLDWRAIASAVSIDVLAAGAKVYSSPDLPFGMSDPNAFTRKKNNSVLDPVLMVKDNIAYACQLPTYPILAEAVGISGVVASSGSTLAGRVFGYALGSDLNPAEARDITHELIVGVGVDDAMNMFNAQVALRNMLSVTS